MKKWLLAVLVCTLAVTGCSKYKQVSDLPETDETTETESMGGETTEETLEVQQETEPAEPQKERVRVKGVYISGYMAGSEGFQAILDKIGQTEINAVVIDVKNDDGRITFSMDDAPTVNEIGASERYIRDIGALMADLKARGIYTIARVVAFRDPYLAEKKPEWSLKNADGSLHRDNKGLAWVNPYRQEVWDYLVEVGTQAAKAGFDEIQFDYIRFATDSTMKQVAFDEADTKGRSKTDIITEFITYAYDKLSAEGIFVSADVFGTIIGSKIDADAVGQVYNDMARHLDYICPMIYPSHYGDGNFGIEHPDTQPYDTIHAALMKSKQDLAIVTAAGEDHAIVRPWLQDFTASYLQHYIKYGPAEVRAQIQAVYDAGYDEWILWSASNKYTWDGLLSPEEASQEDQKIAESRAALPPETTVAPPTEAAKPETAPAPEETLPQEGQPSEETSMEETEAPVDETSASEELQTSEDPETEATDRAASAQPETAAQGEKRSKPNVVIVTTGGAGEKMVVYQALYGTFGTYVRPLSMFISEVDHEKYPEVKQKYRFERVELKEEAAGETSVEHAAWTETEEAEGVASQEAEEETAVSSKILLAFLDAETYYEKLEVLKERREIFSEEELAAVCESLDIGSGTGTREGMYRAAVNYLEMQAKYDGARLR